MRIFIIVLTGILLYSCSVSEQKSATSPLKFSTKKFQLSSQGCEKDTLTCASYEVNYPVFEGLSPEVDSILQKKIDASVSMGNPEANGWTMDQIAKEFIKGYEQFTSDNPESANTAWYYKVDINVENTSDSLICLSSNEESYTGGAHGSTGKYFININRVNGNDIKLEHVLKPGYEEVLRAAGERSFRKLHSLSDTTSFIDHEFEFPNDKFQLSHNYGFLKEGIVFFFNSYEIGPYSIGTSEIVVPYEEIKDWLRRTSL